MSRPKVVLYNPRGESHVLPLALLHLGSMLPDFDVRIVDGRIDLTPESTLSGLADGAVALGVTVLTGRPILDALRASRAVKRRHPRLPVIWGGWHPSLLPDQCLAAPAVDACVRGQGEETFRDAVLSLVAGRSLEGVAGLSHKRGAEVIPNPPRPFQDVNAFPEVGFGLIDVERYFALRGARRLDYCSSQVCPVERARSADPMAAQGRWSGLEAGRVVAEIAEHRARFRAHQVSFADENFFADLSRAETVVRGLIEQRVGVEWSAAGPADLLRLLTPDQMSQMRESGCGRIDVGADGGPFGAVETKGGGTLLEGVIETAEKLNRAGIGARFSFVAGVPGEPASSLAETYRTIKALRKINSAFETPIAFHVPYPGSGFSHRLPARGLELPARLEDWGRLDLDHATAPWIPEPVRKFVPRYNFYFRHAFEPLSRGFGKRVARWFARLRVRHDFYRFDFERRLVDLSRRLRTGARARPQSMSAEN